MQQIKNEISKALRGRLDIETVKTMCKSVPIWSYPGPFFPAFGLSAGKHGPE